MKYRFFNAQIWTNGNLEKGTVLVENEKIVYVGKNPPMFQCDKEINVNNNLLMAGFVNAHCHTPSTILRGIYDDLPLHKWLDKIIPLEQKMTGDDAYWSTMLGIAEYVSAGITTIEENYGKLESLVKAITKSGIRARVSIGYSDVNTEPKLSLNEQYKLLKDNNIKAVCYAHSIYGTSEENFAKLNHFAKTNNLPVSTHLSETLKEVGDCSAKYDLSPPELLEDFGFLDRKTTLYHCVHCDKDDLNLIADYNASIVTCPSSNLKLGSGIAPIFAMQNANINIAIGTDGAYSNNCYDMFKEMFLVATLNKATLNNAEVVKAEEVLDMSTKNGAKALGFDKIGDIKKDNYADLILIDLHKPHFQPNNNLISNLVYCGKSSDVYFTMINGKIVYENGVYNIGENIEDIYYQVKKIIKKLRSKK